MKGDVKKEYFSLRVRELGGFYGGVWPTLSVLKGRGFGEPHTLLLCSYIYGVMILAYDGQTLNEKSLGGTQTPPGNTLPASGRKDRYFRSPGIDREVLAKRGPQSVLSAREAATDSSPGRRYYRLAPATRQRLPDPGQRPAARRHAGGSKSEEKKGARSVPRKCFASRWYFAIAAGQLTGGVRATLGPAASPRTLLASKLL